VELAAASIKALAANIESLGVGAETVVHKGDALRFAERLAPAAFDLAFADPPYGFEHASRLVTLFRRTPFARILSVEHRADEAPGGDQTRRYGDTAITFCQAP